VVQSLVAEHQNQGRHKNVKETWGAGQTIYEQAHLTFEDNSAFNMMLTGKWNPILESR